MKCIRALVFAIAVAFVLPVLAEDKKEAKFDAAALVGDWTITSGKKLGKDISDEAKKGTYVISKDSITLKEGDMKLFVFTYKLDTKTTPVSIDMEIAESAIDGLKGSKAKGIIALDGKDLKIAYEPTGGDRPKTFDDEKSNMFVLNKTKAEKKDK